MSRYQEYKNKMLGIRKVMNFFYSFRFVFLGVALATAATITTLDLTKGNITDTSEFDEIYTYGDKISFSGEAFMGEVTFEFKEEEATEWTDEVPHLVGKYEARAKSQGNHGYKYSDVSKFKIVPYETSINLVTTSIDFGNDHPEVTATLLPGDTLDKDVVKVTYDDLTQRTTFARIDLSPEHIVVKDSKGNDISDCYTFSTEDKEVTFNKAPLSVQFTQDPIHSYTGESFTSNNWVKTAGDLYYDAHIEYTGGISVSTIDKHYNDHVIHVIGPNGEDYTENYDIKLNDNYIEIEPAPAVRITSKSLEKTYDGKPFEDFDNPESLITIEPNLLEGHHFKLLEFGNASKYQYGTYDNSFTFDIVDDNDVSVDRSLYKGISTTYGSLNVYQRPITLTSKSLEVTFDNKSHSIVEFADFANPEDGLAEGDTFAFDAEKSTSQLGPTSSEGVSNYLNYEIMHGEDVVTLSYLITPVYGSIVVNQFNLKFNFKPRSVIYNGKDNAYYLANDNFDIYDTEEKRLNAAVLDESTPLPEGWTYDVRLPDSYTMKYIGDYDTKKPKDEDVVVHIYDNSEPKQEVTTYFNRATNLSFEYGIPTISKKDLKITVTDYTKEFNNKSIGTDIVIDPNKTNTCVTYDGLAEGDYASVSFDGSDCDNTEVKDTPYKISLKYGVKNGTSSTAKDITDNYDITFIDDKNTIDATITKKDIIIVPGDVTKTYNDSKDFTPTAPTCKAPEGKSLVGSEAISIKADTTTEFKTSSADAGDYKYDLDIDDIVIKIGSKDVTADYNISIEGQGNVKINKRNLKISHTTTSTAPYKIVYDKQEHGIYIGSKEISVQPNSADAGLVSGHTIELTENRIVDPGSKINIASSDDMGIVIKDGLGNPVTYNYNVTHDAFDVEIVKTKVTITPLTQTRIYDGSPFDGGDGLTPGAFYAYSQVQNKLFTMAIETNATDDPLLKGKHTLMLTKYSETTANNAINAGTYDFDYDYKIMDGNTDVSDLYEIVPNSGAGCLTVTQASVNGISCELPADVDNIIGASDGGVFASISAGPNFSNNFTISATFTSGVYDPEQMYAPDTYYIPVFISINSSKGSYDAASINLNTAYGTAYAYTITKASITISTTKEFMGLTYRSWSGELASTDQIYFGDEPLQDGWYEYTNGLSTCRILRNGTEDVTATCYNVSLYDPSE